MGDKAKRGDRLAISATRWNRLVDLSNEPIDRNSPPIPKGFEHCIWDNAINFASYDLKTHDLVSIRAVKSDTLDAEAFKFKPLILGNFLDHTEYNDIGVCLEPIKQNKIGRVAIGGMATARVDITNGGNYCYIPKSSTYTTVCNNFVSGNHGFPIIYKGGGGSSGVQLCVIMLYSRPRAVARNFVAYRCNLANIATLAAGFKFRYQPLQIIGGSEEDAGVSVKYVSGSPNAIQLEGKGIRRIYLSSYYYNPSDTVGGEVARELQVENSHILTGGTGDSCHEIMAKFEARIYRTTINSIQSKALYLSINQATYTSALLEFFTTIQLYRLNSSFGASVGDKPTSISSSLNVMIIERLDDRQETDSPVFYVGGGPDVALVGGV